MILNPVMFVVEIVASLTTLLFIREFVIGAGGIGFCSLREQMDLVHHPVRQFRGSGGGRPRQGPGRQRSRTRTEAGAKLRTGRCALARGGGDRSQTGRHPLLVEAGNLIPSDGEVIEGIASVNEAAIHRRSPRR